MWSQIKADVTGLPVVLPTQGEAASLGSAILAAVGIGLHPDIPSAVSAMVSAGKPLQPAEDRRGVYNAAYGLYVKLYASLKDLYPLSAELARHAK
jgi:xylulokinase